MSQVHTKSVGQTKSVASHYARFFLRLMMLVFGIMLYISSAMEKGETTKTTAVLNGVFGIVVQLWFFGEMLFRILPFKNKSIGCQKQYKYSFRYTGVPDRKTSSKRFVDALPVLGLWLMSNIVIGGLYFAQVIDSEIICLISLFYSVLDIFCVLFFCPFRTFIMKNRCCTTCRIYNWDFFLILTPLVFVPNIFGRILFVFSLVILAQWELSAWLFPERFSEKSNKALSCAECEEKLCLQKKQLQAVIEGNPHRTTTKHKSAVKF